MWKAILAALLILLATKAARGGCCDRAAMTVSAVATNVE
jgi:hypothetical protein